MKITTSTVSFEPGAFKPLPIVKMVFRRNPADGGNPCALTGVTLTYAVSTLDGSLICSPAITVSGTFGAAAPLSGVVGVDLIEILTGTSTYDITDCPEESCTEDLPCTLSIEGTGSCEIECDPDTDGGVFHVHFAASAGHPDLNCGECGTPATVTHSVDIPFADIHDTHDVVFDNSAVTGLYHHWVLTIA